MRDAPRDAPRSAPRSVHKAGLRAVLVQCANQRCRCARCVSSSTSSRSSAGSHRRASAAARASSRPKAATLPWSPTRRACASSSPPRRGAACTCTRAPVCVVGTGAWAQAHARCTGAHCTSVCLAPPRRWPTGPTTRPSTQWAARCVSVPTAACGAQACPTDTRAAPSGRASRRTRRSSPARRCNVYVRPFARTRVHAH